MTRMDKIFAPLIRAYFIENSLIKIMNKLKKYKEDPKKRQMYNNLITRLNVGLQMLENDIKNMSEDEVENKKLGYLKGLVRKIVDANQKLDDMQPLESEKDAAQRQQGQGLKILTQK